MIWGQADSLRDTLLKRGGYLRETQGLKATGQRLLNKSFTLRQTWLYHETECKTQINFLKIEVKYP